MAAEMVVPGAEEPLAAEAFPVKRFVLEAAEPEEETSQANLRGDKRRQL